MRLASWTNAKTTGNRRNALRRVYVNFDEMNSQGIKAYFQSDLDDDDFQLSIVDMRGREQSCAASVAFAFQINEHMEDEGLDKLSFEELYERFNDEVNKTYE